MPAHPTGLKTVLLLDADTESRAALAELLRQCGYLVHECGDGVEGLSAARRLHPDLIIAELWPFFSGAMEMISTAREELLDTPVLVVTSVPRSKDRTTAGMNVAGYLEKPCAPDALLDEMNRILQDSPILQGGVA
jgi:DNA-binding response OmpR family regulator